MFKPGDRIIYKGDMGITINACKPGATAIVTSDCYFNSMHKKMMVKLKWDQNNPLKIAQIDGGYYVECFELHKPTLKECKDEIHILYYELITKRGWGNCYSSLTTDEENNTLIINTKNIEKYNQERILNGYKVEKLNEWLLEILSQEFKNYDFKIMFIYEK